MEVADERPHFPNSEAGNQGLLEADVSASLSKLL